MLKSLIKWLLGKGIASQFGEDKILLSLLPESGTYVDIGAYHPHLYSNTYRLYEKGWNGIAVDPNPDMAPLWRFFRPRDTFLNAALGNGEPVKYYVYNDGACNGFRPDIVEGGGLKQVVILPTINLSEIMPPKVDLLNIDCEGMDLQILESHDWGVKPSFIAAEDDVGTFLATKGYSPVTKAGMTTIYKLT